MVAEFAAEAARIAITAAVSYLMDGAVELIPEQSGCLDQAHPLAEGGDRFAIPLDEGMAQVAGRYPAGLRQGRQIVGRIAEMFDDEMSGILEPARHDTVTEAGHLT